MERGVSKTTDQSDGQPRSLVIITGMSGSGKHTAVEAFEDLGYFCVDNLPTSLVPRLVQITLAAGGRVRKLAIVIDMRLGEPISDFQSLFREVREMPFDSTILFFDATDSVLVRRYSETRRSHPLARDVSLPEGVQKEREKLSDVRALADLIIDTTDFTVHDLRNHIYDYFSEHSTEGQMQVSVLSFGFKHGVPLNAAMLFDVRFLPNPNFEPHLKNLSGRDPAIAEYLKNHEETKEIIGRIIEMLEYLLPKYSREGKSYFTVAIGCTGGRHRSVMVAEEIGKRLAAEGFSVNVIHRDMHLHD